MFILLCMALLLLWFPVIFLALKIGFTVCGKKEVLEHWLNKICFQNKYSNGSKFNLIHLSSGNKLPDAATFALAKHSESGLDQSSNIRINSSFLNSFVGGISSRTTNPASGLPMTGSSPIDSGGNIFGTRRF